MPNDRDFAIIVGINEYQELPTLNGPISDAQEFQKWLINPSGGDVPEGNCKFILAGKNPFIPTQDLIDAALDEIISDGNQKRRLYFFFAGHGIGIDWNSNGLCLPSWTTRFRNKSISSKEYLNYTVGSDFFEEIYFFLDCCRDRLINAIALPPTLGLAKPRGDGVTSLVLYASDFDNPANEAPDKDMSSTVRGYFSQALVGGLNGGAADADGNITVNSLINFTQLKTAELAQADQQVQTVTHQFNGAGITMDQVYIKKGVAPRITAVTFNFQTAGRVEILNSDLQPIYDQVVIAGQSAGPFPLKKGLYEINNLDTNQTMNFKIDGTLDEKSYDF
ncbi:caspase domain-containing protein [Mucilaginibacter sp. OK098]|uniref:caspase family protein n=1 Tax=Mucilaginibacter sp. OK098 TaxID=1855297 RepID=UPI00091AB100|nr:caspase family protein [Mucilaginibacter sp. OK098]SHM81268.1 Caspase domain-containing protein [Mucilaginibacter sp. OK098]